MLPLNVSSKVIVSLCLVTTAGTGIHLEGVHLLDVTGQTEGLDGEAAGCKEKLSRTNGSMLKGRPGKKVSMIQ